MSIQVALSYLSDYHVFGHYASPKIRTLAKTILKDPEEIKFISRALPKLSCNLPLSVMIYRNYVFWKICLLKADRSG